MRRIQIDAGLAQLGGVKKASNAVQITEDSELIKQIFLEILRNPDGLAKIVDISQRIKNK